MHFCQIDCSLKITFVKMPFRQKGRILFIIDAEYTCYTVLSPNNNVHVSYVIKELFD